ncbi:hypothetical protein PsalN5692_00291 [Piscirickettsia salmonis]|nr:hypothetical protein [Piscirickettsia salmonis]QGP48879.1 hypothetical protein PsalN5692_00291 [Piscirickettsia salmonis]
MPGFRDLPQVLRHKIAENLSDEDIIRFAQTTLRAKECKARGE